MRTQARTAAAVPHQRRDDKRPATAVQHLARDEPPLWRANVMRAGYLFMVVGLAAVKWPLLPDADTLPLYEGVVACLLTAMSLLALVGLRYPVRMLPVLLFETGWKVLWLVTVAAPRALGEGLDAETETVFVNCLFVIVIAAVIPWRYAWRRFISTPAEPWRRSPSGGARTGEAHGG